MGYPPVVSMVMIQLSHENLNVLTQISEKVATEIRKNQIPQLVVLGPSDPPIARVNDIYYKRIYLKHLNKEILTEQILKIDGYIKSLSNAVGVLYDHL